MGRTAANPYILCACLGIAAGLLLAGPARATVQDLVAAGGAVSLLIGIHRRRPPRRFAWLAIAAAATAWAAGFVVGSVSVAGGRPVPLSGASAVFHVVGYPLFGAGLVALGWGADSRQARRTLLDAAVLALVLGIGLWVPAFDAVVDAAGRSAAEHALGIAYPIGDLVLIVAAARLVLGGMRSAASLALLAVLGATLAGDLLSANPRPGLAPAGDAAWLAGFALLGATAFAPPLPSILRARDGDGRPGRGRWTFYAVALGALPLTFLGEWLLDGRFRDPLLYLIAGLALITLVVARIALLFADLDEARRRVAASESKFRLVFQQAPIGISIGRGGMLTETNPAFQRMLGYSGDEFAAMHYLEVTDPDDRDFPEQGLLDAGEVRSFSVDKRYMRKDGTAVYTRAHLALDLDGDLGVALIEDATARRELEERLREAQALEAVGKLAGGIAHDFNNLMTAVTGYADLLLHEVAGDRQRRRVEAIQDAAARAADLTRALLAFSRRQVLQVQELDLGALVERAPEIVALGPGVRLETECPEEPVLVHADSTQLERVLVNLTTNACQAMPHGGSLRVTVRPAGDWAELTVADTGTGMTDEVRRRAFEPFFSTRGLGEASGLGLATVHGIVGQSGGSVDVESRLGEGTRVTIRLPRIAHRHVAVESGSALVLTD